MKKPILDFGTARHKHLALQEDYLRDINNALSWPNVPEASLHTFVECLLHNLALLERRRQYINGEYDESGTYYTMMKKSRYQLPLITLTITPYPPACNDAMTFATYIFRIRSIMNAKEARGKLNMHAQ